MATTKVAHHVYPRLARCHRSSDAPRMAETRVSFSTKVTRDQRSLQICCFCPLCIVKIGYTYIEKQTEQQKAMPCVLVGITKSEQARRSMTMGVQVSHSDCWVLCRTRLLFFCSTRASRNRPPCYPKVELGPKQLTCRHASASTALSRLCASEMHISAADIQNLPNLAVDCPIPHSAC